MGTAVVFDIDGVLIDSYYGIKMFYLDILPRLEGFSELDGEVLFNYEVFSEGLGVLRGEWWRRLMPWLSDGEFEKLIKLYWDVRMRYSRLMPGAIWVLEKLKSLGFFIGSVSYKDDIPGLKMERIKMFNLDRYFDDIVIVGEDTTSRSEGLKKLFEKYGFDEILYVDDKPGNLWRIKKEIPRVTTVHLVFQYSPNYPWRMPGSIDYRIHSLPELIDVVKAISKKHILLSPPK